jgi:hypothetical protein
MSNGVFASGRLNIAWNSVNLSDGWGSDVFLKITPNGDVREVTIGADGNGTISELADMSAIIELTLTQTSDNNKTIHAIESAERAVRDFTGKPYAGFFSVEDPLGSTPAVVAFETVYLGSGGQEWGKTAGEITHRWHTTKYFPTDDPAKIMSNIQAYIK